MLDLADGVPYTVQRLAASCWERLRVAAADGADTHEPPTPAVALVKDALIAALQQEDAAHTQVCTSLTEPQKKALKAVTLERGMSLLSAGDASKHKIATSSMQRALAKLCDRGLIREEPKDGALHYRLEDPMIGLWLRWSQHLPI